VRTQVISNGVDTERHAPPSGETKVNIRAALHLAPSDLVLITLSRLHEAKRVDLAMAALDHLPRAALIVVGDGPDMPRLREAARGRQVILVGHVADPRMFIHAADVFVLPSGPRAREGLPMSLLEAASANLRLVTTTDSGVAREVQAAGGTVSPPRPLELARAIRAVMSTGGWASREWAQRHDISIWGQDYFKVLRSMGRGVT
jgi:glycosyltransferase involved in cell wall biosynthesis